MHEYSLIQALVERVEAEARARAAVSVQQVDVRIGEAAGVDVELFKTAYRTFRERTICEQAELNVLVEPVRWACTQCDSPIEPGRPLSCPVCRTPARLVAGDEIVLERIEMEVG